MAEFIGNRAGLKKDENFSKKPNCSICKYHEVTNYAVIGKLNKCAAQGFKHCEIAYNTENCKILFEPER